MVKNQVQLITYPDSLGGDLKQLNFILEKYFPGLFSGGIHILPPFPSSGDRGFAPLTYLNIKPEFGTWEDIKRIGEKHDILIDLMVNHISARSSYFQDYLEKGSDSEFADLFIQLDKVWPDGTPNQDDINKIFLRREKPFSEFLIKSTRQKEKVWTTFGTTTPSEQIDLDNNSPITRKLLSEFLNNFRLNNIKIVRLDAVGYVTKKIGTSCFFIEPDIYKYLEWIRDLARSMDIEILPEIHIDFNKQIEIAEAGYWIYDFILPYLILEAILTNSGDSLNNYIRIRPHNQFTMLDCHDGIPIIPDLNGFYEYEDARKVVDICLDRGANLNLLLSQAHNGPDGFNVHQINGAIYSLLACNDSKYLIARAIQFFVPGIPQVYYVGLLAGKNDLEAVARTGENREINRHNYSVEEIDQEVKRPVVQKLIDLIELRNSHPAFTGDFQLVSDKTDSLILSWNHHDLFATLSVDFKNLSAKITYVDPQSKTVNKVVL